MRRRRVLLTGAAAITATAGAGGLWRLSRQRDDPPATVSGRGTATVVRIDLTAREQMPGTLGYAGAWQLTHAGPPGILTSTPRPGTVVEQGQPLYEVNGRSVYLLYGARPVWRDFDYGMSPGEDVRQLETALGLPQADDRFTDTTAAAIRQWQRQRHLPQTGRLMLGAIVFAPEAVRVTETLQPLGTRTSDSPLLRVSSTRRVVTAPVPAARQGQVQPGSAVDVTMPGGQRAAATITSVEPAPGADGQPSTTSTLTASLDQTAPADLGQVAVQLTITTGKRQNVLAVPVTALLAAQGTGYEVMVVNNGTRTAVAVRPGLLDERAGLIEIITDGLTEGMTVEVPQP